MIKAALHSALKGVEILLQIRERCCPGLIVKGHKMARQM